MKILIPTCFLFSLALASAGEFIAEFEALKKDGDDAALQAFLEKAAEVEKDNPDYYASAGNYWWGIAESVAITSVEEGSFELDPEDLTIRDPKTGEKVGAIGKAGKAHPEIPKRALGILQVGAKKFPQRADIALGLAHVQREMGLAEGYVATLGDLLAEAKKNPQGLKWTGGAALPEPAETFLPETVQTYTGALFNANTPATDALCGKLLAAATDAFPDHPYAYNLQAALADATGKPAEALRLLEVAHSKAPGDPLILENLAGAYAKSGQPKKAVASYEKLLKLELDPKTRRKAEAALQAVRKPAEG